MSFFCLQIFQKNKDFFPTTSSLASKKGHINALKYITVLFWRLRFVKNDIIKDSTYFYSCWCIQYCFCKLFQQSFCNSFFLLTTRSTFYTTFYRNSSKVLQCQLRFDINSSRKQQKFEIKLGLHSTQPYIGSKFILGSICANTVKLQT